MNTHVINTDRYPLHDRSDPRRVDAVRRAILQLHDDGCAVVPDIVPSEVVAVLREEIAAQVSGAHFSTQKINPYFGSTPNPHYPDRHPVNTFTERSSGFIAGDAWPERSVMRELFTSTVLTAFIAECLEIPELYPYADPLAGLTANILEPGQQFSWHFDTNDFAVTLLIQAAQVGGLFQYVPAIRSSGDEAFTAIQTVLEAGDDPEHHGGSDHLGIKTLNLRPGDLQIFRGRHSLHRVTRVAPESSNRYAVILAYTEQPGVIGRVDRTRQLFGRVLPEHLAAEEQRIRPDALID